MKPKERASIIEAIDLIMGWIVNRRPGPIEVDWVLENTAAPLVLSMTFPSLKLTEEEIRFIHVDDRISSMNGSMPGTLTLIGRAQERLSGIGGHLNFWRAPQDGFSFELAFPGEVDNLVDASEKIKIIQQEITEKLNQSPPS